MKLYTFFSEKYSRHLYVLFRVLVGLLFLQHGAQKLFGWFGGGGIVGTAQYFSGLGLPAAVTFAYLVGMVEFFGGLALALGLFSRLAASLALIDMVVAWFIAHVPAGGWIPIVNRGELVLLFLAAFLIVLIQGNQSWSLERALFKKEIF